MTAPRDGLPTNLPETVRAMLEEMSERDRRSPLLVLRRRGCGCWLGAVYRLPSGRLLMGQRRALVQTTVTAARARLQAVAIDVDALEVDFGTGELACQHGGAALDRAALAHTLDTATRQGGVHVL